MTDDCNLFVRWKNAVLKGETDPYFSGNYPFRSIVDAPTNMLPQIEFFQQINLFRYNPEDDNEYKYEYASILFHIKSMIDRLINRELYKDSDGYKDNYLKVVVKFLTHPQIMSTIKSYKNYKCDGNILARVGGPKSYHNRMALELRNTYDKLMDELEVVRNELKI
jgi:hypothetical protein